MEGLNNIMSYTQMNNQSFSLCGEGVFIPTTRPTPNELVGSCESLGMGDDGSGGDGILGRGNDKGDSGDNDGDEDTGAIRQALMCASKDDGKGV
ncbi:hypothetical protein Tco_1034636 [Tanacetum coccineum]